MNIIDTYPEILALIERSGKKFDKAKWDNYISGIFPALVEKLEKDSGEYDFDKEIAPVLNMAFAKPEKLEQAHEAFAEATAGLAGKTSALFGFALPVDIILYIGLCNGAGWAANEASCRASKKSPGSTGAAWRICRGPSAFSSCILGRPPVRPLAFAAANLDFVRSAMRSRSNWHSPAKMVNTRLPCGVVVSSHASLRPLKCAPLRSCWMYQKHSFLAHSKKAHVFL